MRSLISFPIVFALCDWVASIVAWSIFFIYRKRVVIPSMSLEEIIEDHNYWIGVAIIPVCWILWYYFSGAYHFVRHKPLLAVASETAFSIFVGSTAILLFILVDDDTLTYIPYLKPFLVLLTITFSLVWTSRVLLLAYRNYCYKKGFWAKNTLIIEDDSTGLKHLTKRHNAPIHSINIYELASSEILYKGYVEVLLLLKKPKSLQVLKNESYKFSDQVLYKIPAELAIEYHDEYHFEYYHDQDFFSFSLEVMPTWQKNFKRIVDIIFSITGLVLLSPIMIFSAIKISLSSPGPIFFKQTRVGKNRRLFEIIKFRSMYLDSEKDGPTLSFSGDERCTPWGKFMRTYRIDEIPQLWNVIKGDMSIVGPRPERPFFLSQLTEYSDQLNRIYAVRPGITSWGQVKYGYASDISQMLKRLKFDFLYLDNRSVFLDFRIMFLTLAVILKGEGK